MKLSIHNSICAFALMFGIAVHADAPPLINYQGRLFDTNSEPVNDKVSVQVRIFTQETGGNALWEQTMADVLVLNGLYNFHFGNEDLSDTLTNEFCWLELAINGEIFSSRQRLVSVPYALHAEVAGAVESMLSGVPSGLIVMWHGSLNEIPDGWLLCNGSNGTPDLRDTFVYGASDTVTLGTTGGANSYSLTAAQLPDHTHAGSSATTGAHGHSASSTSAGAHGHTASIGNASHTHNHKQRSYTGTYPKDSFATSAGGAAGSVGTSSSGGHGHSLTIKNAATHTHSITINSAGAHSHDLTIEATGGGDSIDSRPESLVLAFIMKD